MSQLTDQHGRTIRYLRMSVTSACAMRCVYCRPRSFKEPCDSSLLTGDEIVTLVNTLVQQCGLRKVRITGGEPTSRADLIDIIARLPKLGELAMTTNGLSLARKAAALAEAGLQRVNISLDSIDPQRFKRITGIDGLSQVIDGIDAAIDTFPEPVKINTVVVRRENDRELIQLLQFAAAKALEIRFIELMPMGPLASVWKQRYVTEREMMEHLGEAVVEWESLPFHADAARRFRVTLHDGSETMVGFITPMSCPFCANCDRLRIASNGDVYPCLMDQPSGNLMNALRPRIDQEQLVNVICHNLKMKAVQHPATSPGVMTRIGG